MTYKKNCNFRLKLKACGFKPEDCNKEKCDFYRLKWSWLSLLKVLKQEQNQIKKLKRRRGNEKAIKDKEFGIAYIGQAICEITGFNPSKAEVEELRKSIKKS